jgi:Domain of unknown function (DUF1707)
MNHGVLPVLIGLPGVLVATEIGVTVPGTWLDLKAGVAQTRGRRASLVVDRPRAEVAAMPGPGDEIAPGAGGRAHMRASHADRDRVVDMLKTAFVQGRLAKDELDLRVGQALASRTYADLSALTADIPAGPVRTQSPNPARKPASVPMPTAVRAAVGLMCAGAVLTLADVATVLVTLGGVRWAAAHDLGAGQWPVVMLTQVGFWLVSAPVGAGVWLWLAWANGRGYQWARAAFVAFFVLLTIVLLVGLGGDRLPYTWRDVLATTVLWLVGLVAMALIFSQTASRHYQRRAAARAADPRHMPATDARQNPT